MKFITEEDLRILFKKEPFTIYNMKAGERLTPGGRQFLLDKRINIMDTKSKSKKDVKQIVNATEVNKESKKIAPKNNFKKQLLYSKLRSAEALFLVTAEELLTRDIFLAQDVINIGKDFSNIKNHMKKDNTSRACSKECTGIKLDNMSDNIEDCIDITEFHIQLEKGRDIIILHRLRCTIREIEPFVLDLFEGIDDEEEFLKGVIGKVNQSINNLSQLICSVIGGKTCQRNS